MVLFDQFVLELTSISLPFHSLPLHILFPFLLLPQPHPFVELHLKLFIILALLWYVYDCRQTSILLQIIDGRYWLPLLTEPIQHHFFMAAEVVGGKVLFQLLYFGIVLIVLALGGVAEIGQFCEDRCQRNVGL